MAKRKTTLGDRLFGRYIGMRLTLCIVLLSLFVLYKEPLKALFRKNQARLPAAEAGDFQARLFPPIPVQHRTGDFEAQTIEISFPVRFSERGCEHLYGAVVAEHRLETAKGNVVIRRPRYLIKFRYDLLNARCQSRQLLLNLSDPAEKLKVQFIRVSVDERELTEVPDDLGLELTFPLKGTGRLVAMKTTPIEPEPPFLQRSATERNPRFSLNPLPGSIELMNVPYDDLNGRLLEELTKRTAKCVEHKQCDEIRIAVARIADPALRRAIDGAAAAGIKIEIIESANERSGINTHSTEIQVVETAPWYWLRGNPYWEARETILPMHTKFAIFGNELVISSNSNYIADYADRTRNIAVVYRDPRVVKIFNEIFAMVRSSFYYPLRYSEADALQILLNADRPRSYSTSSSRSYLEMVNAEDVSTSAYGALFNLLNGADEISIAMSPLTNSCARFGRELCLFDILKRKADEGRLKLLLNVYFYASTGLRHSPEAEAAALWSARKVTDLKLSEQTPALLSLFNAHPENLSIFTARAHNWSQHHERIARLGKSTLIAGSANYARPLTLNTIEVIKDAKLTEQYLAEEETYHEPYFVAEIKREMKGANVRIGSCEFIPEKDLWGEHAPELKYFPVESILQELNRRYSYKADAHGLDLVAPIDAVPSIDPARYQFLPLGAQPVSSYASYLCLADKAHNRFFIVHVKKLNSHSEASTQ